MSLLATFVGAATALAGVWIQLFEQRRRQAAAARAERAGLFGRLLALLSEYVPGRVWRQVEAGQFVHPLREGFQPIRDDLAVVAASEPERATAIFELLDSVSDYGDSLPVLDRIVGDEPIVKYNASREESDQLHARAMALAQRFLAAKP